MDENENAKQDIQNFSDMVNATHKLNKPFFWLLIVTNALWAIVFAIFIFLAYITPSEITVDQNQDFTAQVQTYSGSVTDGN